MKFTTTNFQLLDALKLMNGFVAKSAQRPILMTAHIIADAEKQSIQFEATDSLRAAKWCITGNVEESGNCLIEITDYLLSLLKSYRTMTNVTIYKDDNGVNADIDGNIIKIMRDVHGEYPNLNVFDFEVLDHKPVFDINRLQSSLKAIKSAGVRYVEFSFGNPNKTHKVKMIGMSETLKPVFETLMLSVDEKRY